MNKNKNKITNQKLFTAAILNFNIKQISRVNRRELVSNWLT